MKLTIIQQSPDIEKSSNSLIKWAWTFWMLEVAETIHTFHLNENSFNCIRTVHLYCDFFHVINCKLKKKNQMSNRLNISLNKLRRHIVRCNCKTINLKI